MKFKLEIEMGNEAVLSVCDIQDLLSNVSKHMGRAASTCRDELTESFSGNIYDYNGNNVGTWKFVE